MSKTTVTITLKISELIYDVENTTFLTGRAHDSGTNVKEVAGIEADDMPESRNQILRSLCTAFANLRAVLHEYIDEEATTADDELMSEDDIVITLMMPQNFNLGVRKTLASAMHQYLTATAVCDWLTITDKDDAANYASRAASALDVVRGAMNKRVRPERS